MKKYLLSFVLVLVSNIRAERNFLWSVMPDSSHTQGGVSFILHVANVSTQNQNVLVKFSGFKLATLLSENDASAGGVVAYRPLICNTSATQCVSSRETLASGGALNWAIRTSHPAGLLDFQVAQLKIEINALEDRGALVATIKERNFNGSGDMRILLNGGRPF